MVQTPTRQSGTGPRFVIVESLPEPAERLLRAFKIDFPEDRPTPSGVRWVFALVVSLVGSLAIDALLVAIGEAIFPATKGYVHFRFSDYAALTIIGVIIACVAWPIMTAISSRPRWVFFREAILVTLVLWLPDLWLLTRHQPGDAVLVLMLMHLTIALVTYNALVHLAPPRDGGSRTALRSARVQDFR
jgi:hypothetical protein